MTNEERTLMRMLLKENEELRKLVDLPEAEWKFKDADTCSARYICSNCGYEHEVYCAETMLLCEGCGRLMKNPKFHDKIKDAIEPQKSFFPEGVKIPEMYTHEEIMKDQVKDNYNYQRLTSLIIK